MTLDSQVNPEEIKRIVQRHCGRRPATVQILREIQATYGYLPESALRTVAKESGQSLVDVYAVATFYHAFRLKPKGKHEIRVCLGTACHVHGGSRVVEEFERRLGIRAGETTPDGQFSLSTVNCLGACALGPIVVVDGQYSSKVKATDVRRILAQARQEKLVALVEEEEEVPMREAVCPHCRRNLLDARHPLEGQPSIRVMATSNGHCRAARLYHIHGTYGIASDGALLDGMEVSFSCPHCGGALHRISACPVCGSPMAAMRLGHSGVLQAFPCRACHTSRQQQEGGSLSAWEHSVPSRI